MDRPLLVDAAHVVTRALPNGAASVTSTAIDLDTRATGDFKADCELLISAPILTTAELANAATVTYDVVASAAADLSSPTIIAAAVLVQTGAGGVGAAAATARFRFASNVNRYVGVKATNSGVGNASAKSLTANLVF